MWSGDGPFTVGMEKTSCVDNIVDGVPDKRAMHRHSFSFLGVGNNNINNINNKMGHPSIFIQTILGNRQKGIHTAHKLIKKE